MWRDWEIAVCFFAGCWRRMYEVRAVNHAQVSLYVEFLWLQIGCCCIASCGFQSLPWCQTRRRKRIYLGSVLLRFQKARSPHQPPIEHDRLEIASRICCLEFKNRCGRGGCGKQESDNLDLPSMVFMETGFSNLEPFSMIETFNICWCLFHHQPLQPLCNCWTAVGWAFTIQIEWISIFPRRCGLWRRGEAMDTSTNLSKDVPFLWRHKS